MLNVTEVEGLLFELLADSLELLGFAIEFRLHIVEVLVQLGDRLLEVVDHLVFEKKFPLLCLNIVLKKSFVPIGSPLLSHGRLKALEQLFLGCVQVLHKTAHTLILLCQVTALGLFSLQVLRKVSNLILEVSLFAFE